MQTGSYYHGITRALPSKISAHLSWRRLLVTTTLPFVLLAGACADDGDDANQAMDEPTEQVEEAEPADEDEMEPTQEPTEEPDMEGEATAEPEGDDEMEEMEGMEDDESDMDSEMSGEITSDTGAAELRAGLSTLLSEHVYLAGYATDAALGERAEEYDAAVAALDQNSIDLAAAIGSVYGEEAEGSFLEGWRTHIGFFVDYTNGVATGDEAAQQEAADNLAQYGQDFGAFLESANPNLTQDAIAMDLETHVSTLVAAVNAQAAGDPEAFSLLRAAANHMPMTGTVLADAISQQNPDMFDGSATSGAAELRAGLNTLLSEHVYLAAGATNAALGGREDGFNSAAAALDENSVALSEAIGSVYGDEAAESFLGGWRTHIGFFVDYTNGVATGDEEMQNTAVDNLVNYSDDFGAFIGEATGLPADVVAELVGEHVLTLKDVVDQQAAGDQMAAYMSLRDAANHMSMIADPLAEAIVDQTPENFE